MCAFHKTVVVLLRLARPAVALLRICACATDVDYLVVDFVPKRGLVAPMGIYDSLPVRIRRDTNCKRGEGMPMSPTVPESA